MKINYFYLYLFSIALFNIGTILKGFGLAHIYFIFAVFVIILYFIKNFPSYPKVKYYFPLFIFLIFAFFNSFLANYKIESLFWVFKMFVYIIFAYIGTNIINEEKNLILLFKTLVFSAFPLCLLAIFQVKYNFLPPSPDINTIDYIGDNTLRAGSGFIDTNYFAFQLTLSLLLAIFLYYKYHKVYYIPIILMFFLGNLLTFSRTFIIASSIVILFLLLSRNIKAWIMILIVFVITFISFKELILYRFVERSSIISMLSRLVQVERGLNMLKVYPFLGVGGDNFYYLYDSYTQSNMVSDFLNTISVMFNFSYYQVEYLPSTNTMHNMFLKVLFENGIIGFICFTLFFYFLLSNRKGKIPKSYQLLRKFLIIYLITFGMFFPIESFIFTWVYILIIGVLKTNNLLMLRINKFKRGVYENFSNNYYLQ